MSRTISLLVVLVGLSGASFVSPVFAMGGRGMCEADVLPSPLRSGTPTASCSFAPTTRVEIVANFDASLPPDTFHSLGFGSGDLEDFVRVQDSLGQPRLLKLYWRRGQAAGEWVFEVGVDPDDSIRSPVLALQDMVIQRGGILRFDSKGAMIGATEFPVVFEFSGDVAPEQEIVFSFEGDHEAGPPSTTILLG